MQPTEDDLLAQARAGDRAAFSAAIGPHVPMLLAYSRAISGDFHLAEDVVQETAMIAYRNLHHLFPEADFASWLKAIARRQSLAVTRKSRRLRAVTEQALENAYSAPGPEETRRDREALSECLEELSGRSAQVVKGFYFESRPVAELSSSLGINLNTLKTLLRRARMSLRDCVIRRLGLGGAV